uniref:Uncharacterized protein n=1 Tax=Chromera velia CCMP2878 TaxID=1169474 RepID=A0A0G4HSM4_9ALVE|eukprot:Cvel_8323.t1-p1 / transcript=Cvel_8323.t1 / gene=Cvel_8323 / organism=Chromera_velia_CCMP2878 / gene_product=hypothetical protein / transcript_product=hypothetical protein / location=Cvel_scaffold457:69607-74333(-) / protein_length=338 / sequence_SO=supercontig / SO=protein_coding / is_pseudo=false
MFLTASYGAELQELVRYGGSHVDIVFNYFELPFVLQDIPIYKAACATEGEGSEMTADSSTSEENKEGGGNFNPFQDYPGGEAARHLIGGDLEDLIVSRRPCEFRYEEVSGGEMVCAEEVEASPLLEGVDGESVRPLLRGAFKSGMDRKLFDSSLSFLGESKGEGGQDGNMNDSFSSYSSSPSLSGVSPGLGGEGRGSDKVDDGAFSDVNVEELPCDAGDRPPAKFSSSFASARFFPSVSHTAARLSERYVATSVSSDIRGAQPFFFPLQSPAGIQIQTGQLEMHAQQEGGDEGEREEKEEAERDSEPRKGARRLPKREEREDGGGVPPSPVAEDVEVD